jgi:glycerol-3-phosphate acyltransferase PlsY
LGSFPSAYIFARVFKGVDIRDVDTGNVGAGSVMRTLGVSKGIAVGFLDAAKGFCTCWLTAWVLGRPDTLSLVRGTSYIWNVWILKQPELFSSAAYVPDIWVYSAGFAALLGHCFPLYIGFRGGQGVATVVGIFLYVAPLAGFCTMIVLNVLLLAQYKNALHRIFLSCLIASPTLPVFIWIFYPSLPLLVFSLIIIIFIVVRNIPRIKSRPSLMSGNWPEKGKN